MLDILDKNQNVIAVLLDNGTVVKKENLTDDLEKLVRDKISELNNNGK